MAHTPGPWTAEFNDGAIWVTPPNRSEAVICDLQPRDADAFTDEDEANAHLIAAAPELYAVLTRLVGYCSRRDGTLADYADWLQTFIEDGSTITDVVERAVAAIAKAEGRT